MAASEITIQAISRSGLTPSYEAANVDGNYFANGGNEFIHVKNGDSSPHTVTIETPNTVDGLEIADRVVSVPATSEKIIGPFPAGTYNDGSGNVNISYDAITSMTVAALVAA